MPYLLRYTNRFRKQYKKLRRSGQVHVFTSLNIAMDILAEGNTLPISYRSHALSGTLSGRYECHVRPDWLLVYTIYGAEKVLEFVATGTHASLVE